MLNNNNIFLQIIYGVSIHPKYGGWFYFREAFIFDGIKHLSEQHEPPNVVPTQEQRIELLERFNDRWSDWSYRDIIDVQERYSEEQKTYFGFDTPPETKSRLLSEFMNEEDGSSQVIMPY